MSFSIITLYGTYPYSANQYSEFKRKIDEYSPSKCRLQKNKN